MKTRKRADIDHNFQVTELQYLIVTLPNIVSFKRRSSLSRPFTYTVSLKTVVVTPGEIWENIDQRKVRTLRGSVKKIKLTIKPDEWKSKTTLERLSYIRGEGILSRETDIIADVDTLCGQGERAYSKAEEFASMVYALLKHYKSIPDGPIRDRIDKIEQYSQTLGPSMQTQSILDLLLKIKITGDLTAFKKKYLMLSSTFGQGHYSHKTDCKEIKADIVEHLYTTDEGQEELSTIPGDRVEAFINRRVDQSFRRREMINSELQKSVQNMVLEILDDILSRLKHIS